MELFEAIDKRRTIRAYKSKASEEQLRRLLSAGSKAPTGLNLQTWEFIIIDEQKIADQLAEIKYQMNRKIPPRGDQTQEDIEKAALFQKKSFDNASIVAVCCGKGHIADGWLSVENISLAAVGEGIGTGIVGLMGEAKKQVEDLLGVPEDYEVVCLLKIGVPAGEVKPPPKREAFSWLHRNRF
jgi:nitroreductase